MTDYGLGRLPAVDQRDRLHLMRAAIEPQPLPAYRYYRSGPILDQGATSSCVGHAWRAWLTAAPLMTRSGPDPFTIYREAQKVDEWEGEQYNGTSVRAGAKVLASLGHISRYLWAFTAADIATWILSGQGSVVLGTDWTRSMFTPDTHGIIRPTDVVVGGHAYLCIGYSRRSGRFRIQNSWGSGWGERGRAWLLGEDLERLMRDGGEAATATEQGTP